jgi:hypothetical protein
MLWMIEIIPGTMQYLLRSVPPASSTSTVVFGSSERRPAMTPPADPDPTMM